MGIIEDPYRLDSQAKYVLLARGDVSLYLRAPRIEGYKENIWDHAAGSIIVEEAGGEVTDFNGNRLDFSHGTKLRMNSGVLATNGHLHQKTLKAITDVIHPRLL